MKTENQFMHDYLKREHSFKPKWVAYNSRKDLRLNANHYQEKIAPLYSMKFFSKLTQKEKTDSYHLYIQFIAEMQIFLEKILVYGFFKFRKSDSDLNPEVRNSMRLLAREELYHTQGYQNFIDQQAPSKPLFIHNRFFRKAAAFCLNHNPLAITLIGAKFEAVSAPYFAELVAVIEDKNDPWFELNKIHMQDEVFHVPLQFDVYNSTVKKFGFIKTIIPMFFLYMVFQLVLLKGMRKLIKQSYPNRSTLTRNLIILPQMVYWASRKMESFQKSRVLLSKQFKAKAPRYRRALKFIYA